MKYAIISDTSVQWFSYLISLNDKDETVEKIQISFDITRSSEYVQNFYNRHPSFQNLKLMGDGEIYAGVWLSEYEYNRVSKILELHPYVQEYTRLGEMEKI